MAYQQPGAQVMVAQQQPAVQMVVQQQGMPVQQVVVVQGGFGSIAPLPQNMDHGMHNLLPAMLRMDPNNITTIYRAPISDAYRCSDFNPMLYVCNGICGIACGICTMGGTTYLCVNQYSQCSCCCWSAVKPRFYAHVQENRVEVNQPAMNCCCLQDNIKHRYFDSVGSKFAKASCSPYHCCGCIPIFGEVVSFAPTDACNNCLCFWLGCSNQVFIPGLEDAEAFAAQANAARDAQLMKGVMKKGLLEILCTPWGFMM